MKRTSMAVALALLAFAGVGLAALAPGCTPRPRAPALIQGEPVYQNKQEGFRLVPPPNWRLDARSELPPGPAPVECLLVQYRRVTTPRPASFDVSMLDVPASTTLEAYLAERGPGRDSWKPAGAIVTLDVGGQPAARAAFKGLQGKDPALKEIVAVRKGERVYFFISVVPADDAKARDQVRKAVASISW